MGKRAWLLLTGSLISSVGDRFAAIAYALSPSPSTPPACCRQSSRQNWSRRYSSGLIGGTVAAAATFQASATRVLFLIDAAGFLGGAANGLFNVGIAAVTFQGVPQSEQGRAWSAFGILAGSCALPAAVGVLALLVELEPWL